MVTTDVDSTRRAYAELCKLPRAFALFGSTNSLEFADTENRRYPIVAINDDHEISAPLFKELRLQIWRRFEAFENGYNPILTGADLCQMNKVQQEYQSRDPWAPLVFRYIIDKETVSAQAILETALEIPKREMHTSQSKRISKILLQFGWERMGSRKVNGASVRLFRPGPNWDPSKVDL